MFGTPAHPKVSDFDATVLKKLDENLTPEKVLASLKLDEETLAEGSKVYRHQCLHCHGLEGNGRGPTGFWVNPHPRAYRQAVLSFRWLAAESTPIQPDPYPYKETEEEFLKSAARGHQVFNAETQGSCISCHKNYGREAPYSYDEWGTIVRPRNFYDGIFRGG